MGESINRAPPRGSDQEVCAGWWDVSRYSRRAREEPTNRMDATRSRKVCRRCLMVNPSPERMSVIEVVEGGRASWAPAWMPRSEPFDSHLRDASTSEAMNSSTNTPRKQGGDPDKRVENQTQPLHEHPELRCAEHPEPGPWRLPVVHLSYPSPICPGRISNSRVLIPPDLEPSLLTSFPRLVGRRAHTLPYSPTTRRHIACC